MQRNVIKSKPINDFKIHANDTGSTEVQTAMLTQDIKNLTQHFKSFPKDYNSKRGLMMKVGQRSSLMKYLKNEDAARHQELSSRLGLKV